jgi:hypothetical protein
MSAKINIDDETKAAYLELLEDVLTEDTYTMYGLARVINTVLTANGAAAIRPQMMYNYARNGLIVRGEKIFGENLRDLTKSEVAEFVIRYITRAGYVVKIKAPQVQDVIPGLEDLTA